MTQHTPGTMQERSVGQYNFETGYLRISVWGDIPTSEALDLVDVLVKLKRAELNKGQSEGGVSNV